MPAPTPSRIAIAVSGHRELHAADSARARAQLGAALDAIARALPGARLDCLSALAAGADQLFAEEMLALRERLGADRVRLLVPLPMPEAAYIESQESPGSTAFRESYLRLRARAQEVFEIPQEGAAPAAATGSAPYVRLGDYFTTHADLLVALWDGDTAAARQPGGTHDVVMRYLALPGHAVLHLPARRAVASAAAAALPASTQPALLAATPEGKLLRDEDPGALPAFLLRSIGKRT
jgi:hypothetical protein